MADSSGSRIKIDRSFKDTWFEYGIGAAIQTGTNNHVYLDFERSAGGDFKKIGAGMLVHAGLSNNLLK